MSNEESKLGSTLYGQAALLTELLSTALEPHLQKAGVSQATFDLLSTIRATEGGATQAEIARRLRVSPPTLSQAIKGAEEKGFIERVTRARDARVKIVKLTTQGKKAIESTLRAVNQLEQQMVEHLDAAELKTAVAVLRKANRTVASRIQASE
jgi:MarR family transcriptional regulator, lower aerobic nicotinate degradation pathway regulator